MSDRQDNRAQTPRIDLKRYFGERPPQLNRRHLLGAFGASVAAVALTDF
ncbi:MAG: hypothetical protein IT337_01150, partial [Thermomicrobiales bacterium]|nr:hypothetical protein [Thermomicrobiales bacterium]